MLVVVSCVWIVRGVIGVGGVGLGVGRVIVVPGVGVVIVVPVWGAWDA